MYFYTFFLIYFTEKKIAQKNRKKGSPHENRLHCTPPPLKIINKLDVKKMQLFLTFLSIQFLFTMHLMNIKNMCFFNFLIIDNYCVIEYVFI